VIAIALLAELLAVSLNRSLVRVAGGSMEPAMWPGDVLLTLPVPPGTYRVGHVVVVADPTDPTHRVVKRVHAIHARGRVDVRGDAPDRSTDGRHWGPVPRAALRRLVIARWPDLRTPLHARRAAPADPHGRAATNSSSGSSRATSPGARRP
jgi:nickel-type superoxide dismutase maturation protease